MTWAVLPDQSCREGAGVLENIIFYFTLGILAVGGKHSSAINIATCNEGWTLADPLNCPCLSCLKFIAESLVVGVLQWLPLDLACLCWLIGSSQVLCKITFLGVRENAAPLIIVCLQRPADCPQHQCRSIILCKTYWVGIFLSGR